MVAKTISLQSTKRCSETFPEKQSLLLALMVDLMDMSKYQKENDGVTFVLSTKGAITL